MAAAARRKRLRLYAYEDEDQSTPFGSLRPGVRVKHAQFGTGTVISVEQLRRRREAGGQVQRRRPEDLCAQSTPASRSHESQRLGSVSPLRLCRARRLFLSISAAFNPNRKVKARLGEIAAALSIPADEGELGRVTRLAQLRKFVTGTFTSGSVAKAPMIASRDAALAAAGCDFVPPADGISISWT